MGQAISQALGERPSVESLKPRWQHYVSQRYLFPEPGEVVEVLGVDEVMADPVIKFCQVRVKPGAMIVPAENHPARAGVVIAVAASRAAAIAAKPLSISTVTTAQAWAGGRPAPRFRAIAPRDERYPTDRPPEYR